MECFDQLYLNGYICNWQRARLVWFMPEQLVEPIPSPVAVAIPEFLRNTYARRFEVVDLDDPFGQRRFHLRGNKLRI